MEVAGTDAIFIVAAIMKQPLEILITAVREAGQAIVQMRKQGVEVSRKANRDVLTQADLLANQILQTHLSRAFPEDGWLSEESVDDAKRLQCPRVWVIDPIDGTREYIEGVPEYAVSAALVIHGIPALACVFNPEKDELFAAARGEGIYLNNERVQCRTQCEERLQLLASRSEHRRGEWDRFSHQNVQPVGSIAYKLGLVAAGRADATFSLRPKNEWDIAAGVLLVQEGGGIVTDKHGQPIKFNQPAVLLDGIIAASTHAIHQVNAMINRSK